MVLAGFALVFILPLAFLFLSASNSELGKTGITQASAAANTIADEAGKVYLQGNGSKETILVNYPSGINDATLAGGLVVLRIYADGRQQDIVASTFANLTGNLSGSARRGPAKINISRHGRLRQHNLRVSAWTGQKRATRASGSGNALLRSFFLLVFVASVAIFLQQESQGLSRAESAYAQQIAGSFADSIQTAFVAGPGFSQQVSIPRDLLGKPYKIQVSYGPSAASTETGFVYVEWQGASGDASLSAPDDNDSYKVTNHNHAERVHERAGTG